MVLLELLFLDADQPSGGWGHFAQYFEALTNRNASVLDEPVSNSLQLEGKFYYLKKSCFEIDDLLHDLLNVQRRKMVRD